MCHVQLKHIRKKATPSATPASVAATGGRHQKLFLQQLEHAQQQQEQQQQSQQSGASIPVRSHPPQSPGSTRMIQRTGASAGRNGMMLKQKAKPKSKNLGATRSNRHGADRPDVSNAPGNSGKSRRDEQQLQQHRKLMSMEALRKREEARSAYIQAYRDAKHRGGAAQNSAGATSSSLARMVAANQ